jgi:hypothetical protein
MITQELVKDFFDYHEDGYLVWKNKRNGISSNMIAGGFDASSGYRRIKINGKRYKEHRLIFLWHYGFMPKFTDHIDSNRTNNKLSNLRDANSFQNAWNSITPKNNTSGFKGVSWHKHKQKWSANIRVFDKLKYLGNYKTPELAHEAYKKAALELHGEFARFE